MGWDHTDSFVAINELKQEVEALKQYVIKTFVENKLVKVEEPKKEEKKLEKKK